MTLINAPIKTPIESLLSVLEPSNRVLAIVKGEERSAHQFLSEVSKHACHLNNCSEKNWLMWAESAWQFAVQFYALVLSGKDIVLPASVQAAHLSLISENVEGVFTDCKLDLSLISRELKEINSTEDDKAGRQLFPGQTVPIQTLPVKNPSIVLYTSGSTGVPKAIFKNVNEMAEEVLAQQEKWGAALAQHPVISTVGHQHIYGLLHYVLCPLYRGALLVDPICHLAEELFTTAEKYGPCVLVSSPTHLTRFFSGENEYRVGKNLKHFKAIYSSAGMLPREVSSQVEELTGVAPVEIFGSTETGGVAWRQQTVKNKEDACWRSLPGVQVSKDSESGCLKIASEFMQEETYLMSDLVDFVDEQQFILRGRADYVVKVEGKRLSLSEMESVLKTHPWIKDVRLLVIKHRREEVCAAVQLREASLKETCSHTELSRKELSQTFREYLSLRFELPLLPRKWRYLDEFPVDAQGKTTQALLQQLFTSKNKISTAVGSDC